MNNKILSGVSFGLCLVAVGLTVAAIHADDWSHHRQRVGTYDEDYETGIFWVTDEDNDDKTEADSTGLTWYAGKQLYCELHDVNDDDKLSEARCEMAEDMHKAGMIYFVCQLVAILLLVKYMISQIAIMFDRDGGNKWVAVTKSALATILSLVGFTCWWAITGTQYDNEDGECDADDFLDHAEDGDRWHVCGGSGATIGIVAFIVFLMAGIFGIVNALMQGNATHITYSNKVSMMCSGQIHLMICACMLSLCMFFSFWGIFYRHWIHFEVELKSINTIIGSIDDEWTGGLFSLVDDWHIGSGVEISDYSYDGIAVDQCDLDDDTTICKTFEPLMDAGRLYLSLELCTLAFMFLQGAFFAHAIIFSRDWAHPILNLAFAQLGWIMHLVAIVSWIAYSEVDFDYGDCNNDDTDYDEAYDVCIRSGPVISIIQLLLQAMLAAYFTMIYCKRGKSEITVPTHKV